MGNVTRLPSGAELIVLAREVQLDRWFCHHEAPLLPEVCDALNRLLVAAGARRRPHGREFWWGRATPTSTVVWLDVRPADRAVVSAVLRAADAGDHEPADILADLWWWLLPERCPWRFDPGYEIWQAADEPLTRRQLWRRLKALPYDMRGLKYADVEGSVLDAYHRGRMVLVDQRGNTATWTFVRTGEPPAYDPLLHRRRTEEGVS